MICIKRHLNNIAVIVICINTQKSFKLKHRSDSVIANEYDDSGRNLSHNTP